MPFFSVTARVLVSSASKSPVSVSASAVKSAELELTTFTIFPVLVLIVAPLLTLNVAEAELPVVPLTYKASPDNAVSEPPSIVTVAGPFAGAFCGRNGISNSHYRRKSERQILTLHKFSAFSILRNVQRRCNSFPLADAATISEFQILNFHHPFELLIVILRAYVIGPPLAILFDLCYVYFINNLGNSSSFLVWD